MNAKSAEILRTVASQGGFFESADEMAVLAEDITLANLTIVFAYDCYRLTFPLASAAWHNAHAGEDFEGAYIDAITCDAVLGKYDAGCYQADFYATAFREIRETLNLPVLSEVA